MKFHLERGIRLRTQPQYKTLYEWALIEVGPDDKTSEDLIPWVWSLYFTAKSCRLVDSIDLRAETEGSNSVQTVKTTEDQSIRVALRPGRHTQEEDDYEAASFSMAGTNRTIEHFELVIRPIKGEDGSESCTAWGTVSYTSERDFKDETQEDCLIFNLYVSVDAFARYASNILSSSADNIWFRVARVDGFYSGWSPSIKTSSVKVLTRGEEHDLAVPSDFRTEIPRLGYIGETALYFDKSLELGRDERPAETTAEKVAPSRLVGDEPLGVEQHQPKPHIDPALWKPIESLRRAMWFVVVLLALILVRDILGR